MAESACSESRRRFVVSASAFAAAIPFGIVSTSVWDGRSRAQRTPAGPVGGGCDGCEGIYESMPREIGWSARIADESEPGEPMEIGGRVYRSDGTTPAPGVILYVYHTDAKGYYSPASGATGLARRHGHLRGWMRTGASGEYLFRTIRPAPYPQRSIPAHVHPIVKEPHLVEYYLDEYRFEGDPLLTADERARAENRGGSGIIRLERNRDGVWIGRRDIVLGLNIPNYP